MYGAHIQMRRVVIRHVKEMIQIWGSELRHNEIKIDPTIYSILYTRWFEVVFSESTLQARKPRTRLVQIANFVAAFAPLPNLHNFFSELDAKTKRTMVSNKQRYQGTQFIPSVFSPREQLNCHSFSRLFPHYWHFKVYRRRKLSSEGIK